MMISIILICFIYFDVTTSNSSQTLFDMNLNFIFLKKDVSINLCDQIEEKNAQTKIIIILIIHFFV